MEDVLAVYQRPPDPARPLVCMDEASKQLVKETRPGQSAQPESPFYSNLLKLWTDDTYFPLVYTRARVARDTAHTLILKKQ